MPHDHPGVTDRRGNDRQPRRHRFEDNVRKTLVIRGENQHRTPGEQGGNAIAFTQENQIRRRQAQSFCPFQQGPPLSIISTRDDTGQRRLAAPCQCQRFEETIETFARTKAADRSHRSEEHTSELQSLTNLVCRLLLEKKKKRKQSICRKTRRREVSVRDTSI